MLLIFMSSPETGVKRDHELLSVDLLLMNAITQITCVGMSMQTGRAPADNEKEMEIEATAASGRRCSYSSQSHLLHKAKASPSFMSFFKASASYYLSGLKLCEIRNLLG